MKIPSKFSLALLAGTILSTPANYAAAAATLTPTLDTIKAEAADLSGNFALMELTDDLPEGAAEVEIAGVKYYFTPTGDDAALLKTLAGTVAGNLKEDENGIFEFDGKKYSFNTEAIPGSIFEYEAGTAEDYNFTMQEADAEGNLTTKYYKVVLKPETFTTLESIKWSTTAAVETPGMKDSDLSDDNQVKGVVKVDLPNNKSEYYEYTYTKPTEYEIVTKTTKEITVDSSTEKEGGVAINNSKGFDYGNVTNTVFKDNQFKGKLVGNSSQNRSLYLYGGAIYNEGNIGHISSDFINNTIIAEGNGGNAFVFAQGGAISNYARVNDVNVGDITGNFIENHIIGRGGGGAISNEVYDYSKHKIVVGDITGNFIGNYIDGIGGNGGAILNQRSLIGNIKGNFVGNYVHGSDFARGGAIYNYAYAYGNNTVTSIGNITGNFIGNHISGGGDTQGGAIYNQSFTGKASIGNITGNFIGNYIEGDYQTHGGAIFNEADHHDGNISIIGNITGDFIGNGIRSGDYSYGGAIFNSSSSLNNAIISGLYGNFIGNYAKGYDALGGAIFNKGIIGNINGDFIDNYAWAEVFDSANGGAIYNSKTINNIKGNFIGNYVQTDDVDKSSYGGAIYNYTNGSQLVSIGNIDGNFSGNYVLATSNSDNAYGGAIANYGSSQYSNNYNSAVIGHITGNFFNNYAQTKSTTISSAIGYADVYGGAVYNEGGSSENKAKIDGIDGIFAGNHVLSSLANAYGGAIYNGYNGEIRTINGNFIGNYAQKSSGKYTNVYGGAIYNSGTIGDITGDFIGNYAGAENGNAYGGAIYNQAQITVQSSLPDNLIYHLTVKYGNEEAEIYTLPQGSELSANMQMISGTLTVNSEYYFNQYKGKDIRAPLTSMLPQLQEEYAQVESIIEQRSAIIDYVRDISVNDLTVEQYVDYLVMTGDMPEEQKEAALDAFNAMTEEQQAAAMVQAKEEITGAKQSVEIYDYVSAISVDDLTAEQYVDYLTMTGASENMIEDFRQSYQEDASAAMVQAKEAITEIKEQMSGEAELNKIAEEIEQTEQELTNINNMIESGTPVTEITATVDTEGGMTFYNSSFRNNYVKSENGEAKGGAIYGSGVTITADNYTSVIDGNKANDESNAFYVLNKTGGNLQDMFPGGNLSLDAEINMPVVGDLTLNTLNNGVILLNDGIDGESGYGIAFNGDKGIEEENLRTTQYIKLNNSIANAGSINIANTTLSFGEGPYGRGEITADGDPITKVSLQNAAFDLYNEYTETVNLKGWSASNSYLHVDVDVENLTADILNINGNVEGTTKLVLYPTSAKDITGESIVFATATNDTKGTEDSFTVYRVYRSPYMFKVDMTGAGTTEHEWYLTMTDEENEFAGVEPGEQPDPEVPDIDIPDIDIPDINRPLRPGVVQVAPEVIASQSLPSVAIAQTANMVYNIMSNVATTNVADISIDAEANHNLWVNPIFTTMNIESPTDIDADIWGIEAGGDIQRDIHNRLGIFVSYRQGEYDMNGNGDKYRSPVGSEIDIDSYIAGLYYRYDNNNWYAFATLYGGIQEADIKTDDGMKSDTDGVEFGASIEAGYDYALTDSVTLTPELGVFYTQVNYDDATDSVGKSASYDNARQIELEAGVKLAKTFMLDEGFANVYVKPSVVQTIVDGEDVNITGLGDVEALDDATLGRIEIGGRYGFTTNLSAYGWANYTFGSDYDATTFGLGLNYAF